MRAVEELLAALEYVGFMCAFTDLQVKLVDGKFPTIIIYLPSWIMGPTANLLLNKFESVPELRLNFAVHVGAYGDLCLRFKDPTYDSESLLQWFRKTRENCRLDGRFVHSLQRVLVFGKGAFYASRK